MDLTNIIYACKKGDEIAYKQLLNALASTLRAVCIRYLKDEDLAKDALQETFIHIFKYINTYSESGTIEAWSKKIAVNNCLKTLKKQKLNIEIDNAFSIASLDASPLEKMNAEAIIALINGLPELQRIVFNMYVVEGYSHAEIASCLDMSESNSKMTLMRARNKLKMLTEKQEFNLYE